MPLQNIFQSYSVEIGLLEQLFNARFVLVPSHAGGYCNKVFGAENFRGHAFEFDMPGFSHGLKFPQFARSILQG